MKIGDRLAVQIEGVDVGEAVIEDIDEGNAVIVIPATRLVVQMRQSLDLSATKDPEVDRIFGGLEEGANDTSEASEADNKEVAPESTTTTVAPVEAPQSAPTGYNAEGSEVGEGIHGRKTFPGEMD